MQADRNWHSFLPFPRQLRLQKMRKHQRLLPAIAFLSILVFGVPAIGQESVASDSFEQSFSDFDDVAQPMADLTITPAIDITGEGFVSHIPSKSWSFDTELVAFRTRFRGVDFTDSDGDDQYNGSLRFVLGWESKSGFGVRGRVWWQEVEGLLPISYFAGSFSILPNDQTISSSSLLGGTASSSTFRLVEFNSGSGDLDFYKRFEAGQTNLLIGGGLRTAGFQLDITDSSTHSITTGGITLFSELRHILYQTEKSELAFVGGGRIAWLSGDWDYERLNTISTNDANLTTTEGSLGLEWNRNLGWSVLSLRGLYETQFWDSDVSNDLVFNGGVVRVGLSW